MDELRAHIDDVGVSIGAGAGKHGSLQVVLDETREWMGRAMCTTIAVGQVVRGNVVGCGKLKSRSREA